MKGYKIFNSEFQCRSHKFSENSEHKLNGKPIICSSGFHFCQKASDCFSYYEFDPKNIICEVEALGDIVTHTDDSKVATNHIRIGRKLKWEEVLLLANEGFNNTGHSNSGNSNSGNWNSGYRNSGNRNSGDRNSGNRNSGDSNSGYRNSGAFCIDINPYLTLFDKPTKIKVKDWEQMKPCQIMAQHLSTTFWIPFNMMSEDEKKANLKAETTEGYLKTISYKEAWTNMWGNLSDENKKEFTSLKNFDSKIFLEITGINTKKK